MDFTSITCPRNKSVTRNTINHKSRIKCEYSDNIFNYSIPGAGSQGQKVEGHASYGGRMGDLRSCKCGYSRLLWINKVVRWMQSQGKVDKWMQREGKVDSRKQVQGKVRRWIQGRVKSWQIVDASPG